jgi:membrane-associated phospholipid phosphatase
VQYVTDFADQAVVVPIVLAVALTLVFQGSPRGAVAWLSVTCATFSAILMLKLACLVFVPVPDQAELGSPSGHVAAATFVAGGLAAVLSGRRVASLIIGVLAAAAIGVSRIALGDHTFPEVLVGAVVGLAGAGMLIWLGGPPPAPRPRGLMLVVLLVAVVFHGLHMPTETMIRDAAHDVGQSLGVSVPVR